MPNPYPRAQDTGYCPTPEEVASEQAAIDREIKERMQAGASEAEARSAATKAWKQRMGVRR